jgi:hypothetical protein
MVCSAIEHGTLCHGFSFSRFLHLGDVIVLNIDPVDRGWIEAVPPEYNTTTTFKTLVVLTNMRRFQRVGITKSMIFCQVAKENNIYLPLKALDAEALHSSVKKVCNDMSLKITNLPE